jgi:hypothetical protein
VGGIEGAVPSSARSPRSGSTPHRTNSFGYSTVVSSANSVAPTRQRRVCKRIELAKEMIKDLSRLALSGEVPFNSDEISR